MRNVWELPELEREVTILLREEFMDLEPEEDLGTSDDLFEAGLDSMALMQLLLLIQERFEVSIPSADLTRKNFSTVRAIAQIIQKQES